MKISGSHVGNDLSSSRAKTNYGVLCMPTFYALKSRIYQVLIPVRLLHPKE